MSILWIVCPRLVTRSIWPPVSVLDRFCSADRETWCSKVPRVNGGSAPVAVVQTSGNLSPKRSFVGIVANGGVGWEGDGRLPGRRHGKRTFYLWQVRAGRGRVALGSTVAGSGHSCRLSDEPQTWPTAGLLVAL
jgi:hypothetical protein